MHPHSDHPLKSDPRGRNTLGAGRFNLSLIDVLGLILTYSLFSSRESLLGDPGVGWHLRAGEWMTKHHEILRADPFLYPARPWVHDQWLSDILLWSLYSFGGFPLLHLLVAIVCISVFIFVLPLARIASATTVSVFLALFLAALQASVQWFVRPVIFSFLFFSIVYQFCLKRLNADRIESIEYCGLPLLFLFWANLHGGFWLGLFLVAMLSLEFLIRKNGQFGRALILFGMCLAATLVNPWGIGLWKSTLGLALDSYFVRLNQEWLPPELLDAAFLPFTFSVLLLAAGLALKGPKTLSRFDYFSLLPLLLLSFLHRRYLPFYAVTLAVPVMKIFPKVPEGRFRRIDLGFPLLTALVWLFLFAGIVTTARMPFFTSHTSDFPANYPAAEVALIENDPAPVFHTPDVGGYIT